jgi:hypothetical protein
MPMRARGVQKASKVFVRSASQFGEHLLWSQQLLLAQGREDIPGVRSPHSRLSHHEQNSRTFRNGTPPPKKPPPAAPSGRRRCSPWSGDGGGRRRHQIRSCSQFGSFLLPVPQSLLLAVLGLELQERQWSFYVTPILPGDHVSRIQYVSDTYTPWILQGYVSTTYRRTGLYWALKLSFGYVSAAVSAHQPSSVPAPTLRS